VWVGYRGSLPPWLSQIKASASGTNEYFVNEEIRLIFVEQNTTTHFANFKPEFMRNIFEENVKCEYLWYFDPDIFLQNSWGFFRKWQKHGIALCEEYVKYNLSKNSPFRMEWIDVGREMGLGEPREITGYFNSGMVEIHRSQLDFLKLWEKVICKAGELGNDLKSFLPTSREHPFSMADQDALNVAVMFSNEPISTMGPEGMGFVLGGTAMYHTIGPKPWRVSFLARALNGVPPTSAMKYFMMAVAGPICPYSKLQFRLKKISCTLASAIGRFYRKS
jgi:hypothetical protein